MSSVCNGITNCVHTQVCSYSSYYGLMPLVTGDDGAT